MSTANQSSLFPPVDTALQDPNGLLAMGGELSTERLVNAYQHGIFPWFQDGHIPLWWSPDPRAVIRPESVCITRSLRKTMRRYAYRLSVDEAFDRVVAGCAEARIDSDSTWISPDMARAYSGLFSAGHAHSLEVWDKDELIGGLYGVASGRVFSGESMFHRRSDASKIALAALCTVLAEANWPLVDCQIHNPHLESLGAIEISRAAFLDILRRERSALPSRFPKKLPWHTSDQLERTLR